MTNFYQNANLFIETLLGYQPILGKKLFFITPDIIKPMGIENENWLHFLMSLKDNLGRPEENLSKNAK